MRSWLAEGRVSADSLGLARRLARLAGGRRGLSAVVARLDDPGLEAVLAEPVAPVHSHRPAAPQRSRGMQVMIVVVLVVAVLVLAVVLIAVVMNQ